MLLRTFMRLAYTALLFVFLLGSRTAFGQQQNQKAAEQHFNLADKAYKTGDYEKAVQEFLAAYQQVPVNPLLFNIGQAYRLAGHTDKALSYYEKYVEFEPGGPQVAEAKDHIRELKEAIETEKHRKTQEDQAQVQAQADTEAAARAEAQKQAEAARRATEAESAGSGLRIAGLVVGGVGVVALGVGIGLSVADGELTAPSIGIGAGGAAALIGGVVLYVVGVNQRSTAKENAGAVSLIVPTVTQRSVGLSWVGSF